MVQYVSIHKEECSVKPWPLQLVNCLFCVIICTCYTSVSFYVLVCPMDTLFIYTVFSVYSMFFSNFSLLFLVCLWLYTCICLICVIPVFIVFFMSLFSLACDSSVLDSMLVNTYFSKILFISYNYLRYFLCPFCVL